MAVASEPMAMQPIIARQNGRGVFLCKQLPATTSQISSLQRRIPFFADSLLTAGSAVEMPQAAGLGPLAATSLQTRTSPAAILRRSKEPHKRENFTALLQMPRHHCKTCKVSPARGWHSRWVCVMLGEIPRWRCTQRDWLHSLREFQSCLLSTLMDSFLFRVTPLLAPSPFLPPRDLWGKSSGAEDLSSRWQASSRRLNARVPRHHRRESIRLSSSPNTISVPLRLRATWSRLVWVWAFLCWLQTRKSYLALWLTLPSSASRNARLRADEELIRVMTKAVNEIGLEWSPPEKPSRSRLDEWFLPGRHQALRPMLVPLLPWSTRWAHEIVTCPLLVRATEPHHRAVQSHITDSGCAYSVAGQAVSALHSMAVLQVYQAKMLAYEEAGLDSASLRDLRSATDLYLQLYLPPKPPPKPSGVRCPAW